MLLNARRYPVVLAVLAISIALAVLAIAWGSSQFSEGAPRADRARSALGDPTQDPVGALSVDEAFLRDVPPGQGEASGLFPGQPSRANVDPPLQPFDTRGPLLQRRAELEARARAGDAAAAAELATDLTYCRGYLQNRSAWQNNIENLEKHINNPDYPADQRLATEQSYEKLLLHPAPESTICDGLELPSEREIIDWFEVAARLGHVGAMVHFVDESNRDSALADLARTNLAELARVRSAQNQYLREAAMRCSSAAMISLAVSPQFSSSPAERYAFAVLAGWVRRGVDARPADQMGPLLSGLMGEEVTTLSIERQQAALRYANAFYRRYCQ